MRLAGRLVGPTQRGSAAFVVWTIALLGTLACNSNREPASEPDPISSETGKSVPKTLAKAKCSYAFSCDEIGDGQEYSSMEDCMARITNDWAEDLNERDCPGGANEEALSHCIKQIEENDCNSTLDSIASFTACRASDICLD